LHGDAGLLTRSSLRVFSPVSTVAPVERLIVPALHADWAWAFSTPFPPSAGPCATLHYIPMCHPGTSYACFRAALHAGWAWASSMPLPPNAESCATLHACIHACGDFSCMSTRLGHSAQRFLPQRTAMWHSTCESRSRIFPPSPRCADICTA
jgi:hypothetical protein